jgi:N-acetylneuraminic acid mutarotase
VPSGRAFHALFYDQAGDKVFSFGGYDRALDRADVWAYDLEAGFWTLVDPPGESPDPRENHAMVYDTRTRKALLFGGCVTTATFVNDTWSFDPASGEWAKLHPEGELPAARADHALVYDEARGKVILFGGYGVRSDQLAADTWAYDPSTNSWMDLNPAGVVPSARAGCAMVYDSRRGKVFLFGGCELEPSTYLNYLPPSYPSSDALLNDTWTYCPATNAWTKLDPRGESPPARAGHTLAYDKAGDKVYLFGGNGGSTYLDDIWVYDPSANRWGQLKSEGTRPPARTGHALVYDSARGRLILFGGFGTDWVGTYPLRDLWVYKPAP